MRRVLLKLSGEALAGEKKTGFDEETVTRVAVQVKEILAEGSQVAVVIGGGNAWPGRRSHDTDCIKADRVRRLASGMS